MNTILKNTLTLALLLVASSVFAESWQCKNDLEIQCTNNQCKVSEQGEFTSMDIHFDDSGEISVCAYSGCWEGISDVLNTANFLVLLAQDLGFSSALETNDSGQNMSLSLDKHDGIAVLKLDSFAQPLHCRLMDKN